MKLMAGGTLALYFAPTGRAFAAQRGAGPDLGAISPIERTLPDVAQPVFFADVPERAHQMLRDKPGFIRSLPGGTLPPPSQRVPLVIVGGGLSGIVSAYLLRAHNPIVLEQAARFGGNAQGQSWRGIDYSIGAAYFIEPDAGSDIDKLVREIGLDTIWKVKEEEDPVVIDGKISQSFWSGETDPAHRAQFEKLSTYFKAVNEGEKYPYPDIPITDPDQEKYIKTLDRVPFKAHLEKMAGGKLHPQIETAIEQYCWSSFGASSLDIGAASGLNFYASEFSNVIVLPGGNAAVAEAFLRKLAGSLPAGSLRAGSTVVDVRRVNDGVLVSYIDAAGAATTLHAQAVVMACPKFVVKNILDGIEPARLAAIQKLRYHSYLVANVLLKGKVDRSFYDLYMLGNGRIDLTSVKAAAQNQKVTDVIWASYAKPVADNTVLTLYRGMPYEGARPDLYAADSYSRYRAAFETQIHDSILPLLNLKKENIVDLRIARWGHPLPVAATGLIASGVTAAVQKPFRERVFFVEQDNWALPAFETALTEAMTWSPKVADAIKSAKA